MDMVLSSHKKCAQRWFAVSLLVVYTVSVGLVENEVIDVSKYQPKDNAARLAGGTRPWEGRIEIFLQADGQWHTLCNTPRRENVYQVICKTLGFGNFLEDKEFPSSSLIPLRGHFECNKDSVGLRNCFLSEGPGCESNDEETGIVCSGPVPECAPISFQRGDHREMYPHSVSYPADSRVNVMCPSDPSISGVMRCVNGHWEWEGPEPPLCPPQLDDTTMCPAPSVDVRYHFLHPSKMVYPYDEVVEVICRDRSNRTTLRCSQNGHLTCDGDANAEDCIPEAPICKTPISSPVDENIILVGGEKLTKGRVLVKRADEWGSICADGWNLIDAHVICSQLGFGPARDLVKSPTFPPGQKNYLFRNVDCKPGDNDVLACSLKYMRPGDKCDTDLEAEVDCFPEDPQVPAQTGFSARSNCGPPALPNTFVEPLKLVYEIGENVTISCASSARRKGTNSATRSVLTCASDGLWRGDVIDCSNAFDGSRKGGSSMLGTGLVILAIQVVALLLNCYFHRTRIQAPAAEVRDDAPPPNNDAKPQPVNQQTVHIQPQPRPADDPTQRPHLPSPANPSLA